MASLDPDLHRTIATIVADLTAYYSELDGESPRAAAILAVASLENELKRLIRTRLVADMSNTLWERLAGSGSAPFGSLNAKIDMCQALGFFGHRTATAIGQMGSIRNKFAHLTDVRDFGHPKVRAIWNELRTYPLCPTRGIDAPAGKDIQWAYIATIKELQIRLQELRNHIPEVDEKLAPLP
jgi:hypothetical protein